MRRRVEWWLWPIGVILWATAFCSKGWGQGVDTLMLDYLESIADTTTVEHGRCIAGGFYRDTLILGPAFETPWLVGKQWPGTVEWRWWDCPRGTAALWHNHTWDIGMGIPPRSRCFISPPDQSILLTPTAPPIMVVSVKRGVSCFFFRVGPQEWKRVPYQRSPGGRPEL